MNSKIPSIEWGPSDCHQISCLVMHLYDSVTPSFRNQAATAVSGEILSSCNVIP